MAEDWRSDLDVWLAPFLAALRHKTRMRVCPAYIPAVLRDTNFHQSDRETGSVAHTAAVAADCRSDN